MGCSSLQWGAAPCNGVPLLEMGADLQVTLQRVAAPCNGCRSTGGIAMGCSSLQWVAAPCNGLQLLTMGAAPGNGLQLLAMGADLQVALQWVQRFGWHCNGCRSAGGIAMGCRSLQWGAAPCNGCRSAGGIAKGCSSLQWVAAPCNGCRGSAGIAMLANPQRASHCLQICMQIHIAFNRICSPLPPRC